jgi:chromosome segregation ATPase
MDSERSPLIEDGTEEIPSLTAGESDGIMPLHNEELVNEGRRETESYKNSSKELETEVIVLQRQVRELQCHIRQNEDEIKGLHDNMRELRHHLFHSDIINSMNERMKSIGENVEMNRKDIDEKMKHMEENIQSYRA